MTSNNLKVLVKNCRVWSSKNKSNNGATEGADVSSKIHPPDALHHLPSVKRRTFGPYKPFYGLRSKSTPSSVSNQNDDVNGEAVLKKKEDIDFEVDRSPIKFPRAVHPDELCVIDSVNEDESIDEIEGIESVTTRVDLSEETTLDDFQSVEFATDNSREIKDSAKLILSIKREVEDERYADSDKTVQYSTVSDIIDLDDKTNPTTSDNLLENTSFEKSESKHLYYQNSESQTDIPCSEKHTEPLNCQEDKSQSDIPIDGINKSNQLDCVDDEPRAELSRASSKKVFKTFITRRQIAALQNTEEVEEPSIKRKKVIESSPAVEKVADICEQLRNIFHITPTLVVLEDIQMLRNFSQAALLTKALSEFLENNLNVVASKRAKISCEKSSNRIINVNTEASSDIVCGTFEEKVARKLEQKRKLLGLTDTFQYDSTSSRSNSPTKDSSYPAKKSNSPRKDNKSPTKGHCSLLQVSSITKSINEPAECELSELEEPVNDSMNSISSEKELMNNALCSTILYDHNINLNEDSTHLRLDEDSTPSPQHFTIDNRFTSAYKSGSARRRVSPPTKSLAPKKIITRSTPISPSRRLASKRSIIELSPVPLSSDNLQKNPETFDCETIRTVPLHPRIRMKFKSHCNCTADNCSHMSPTVKIPTPTAPQSTKTHSILISPEKSPPPTPQSTETHSIVISPVKSPIPQSTETHSMDMSAGKSPCSSVSPPTSPMEISNSFLETSEITVSPSVKKSFNLNESCPQTCSCNIINCPHVKLPSPRKMMRFELDLTKSDEQEKSQATSPTKRWYRPSLLPRLSPKSPRSLLSRTISTTIVPSTAHIKDEFDYHILKREAYEQVDIDSDTLTGSSCDIEIIYPNIVHISSDEEQEEVDEKLFIPSHVKAEVSDNESTISRFSMDEDENSFIINAGERRQRKTSSKKRIETFKTFATTVVPTFLKTADITENDAGPSSSGRLVKSISKRQMLKLTEHFQLRRVKVKIVNLTTETVTRLVELCSSRDSWNDKDSLQKAGLSHYDIKRLGLAKLRRAQSNARYGFRRFVKKRDIFQSILDRPKTAKKPKRELEFLKSQKRKMKELALAQERAERERKDLESIRRSLLKINARFLNQSKFWSFLDQGKSASKPIEL